MAPSNNNTNNKSSKSSPKSKRNTAKHSKASSKRKVLLQPAQAPQVVLLSSIQTNKLGGVRPANGNAYTLEQKKQIALVYQQLLSETNPAKDGTTQAVVSVNRLSQVAKVSRTVAKKIVQEIQDYGGVVDPQGIQLRGRHSRGIGPGAEIFSARDEAILLEMRQQDRKQLLGSYQQGLLEQTGKNVSMATICRWIQYQDELELSQQQDDQEEEEESNHNHHHHHHHHHPSTMTTITNGGTAAAAAAAAIPTTAAAMVAVGAAAAPMNMNMTVAIANPITIAANNVPPSGIMNLSPPPPPGVRNLYGTTTTMPPYGISPLFDISHFKTL